MNSTDIQNAMITAIAQITGVKTVEYYFDEITEESITGLAADKDAAGPDVAAVIVEQDSPNQADDFGADVNSQQLNYRASVLVWRNRASSMTECRDIAMSAVKRIENTNWNLSELGLANVDSVDWTEPRPDLQQYRAAEIAWSHHALLETT